MLSEDEFKKIFKIRGSCKKAYQLYVNLNRPELIQAAKSIVHAKDDEIRVLRNSLCSKHLIELTVDELKQLLQFLSFIIEKE